MGLWDFPVAAIIPNLFTKPLFGKIPYSVGRRFNNIAILKAAYLY